MVRNTLEKSERAFVLILKWSSVGCLVGLLVFLSAGIFVRFVPIGSMGWADEVLEFAFAWMIFFGTAVLWRERSHFRVDLISNWLAGSRAGQILEIFLNLLALVFFLVFTYEGGVLTMRTTEDSPILALPKALWYMIMPISGCMLIGYTVRDLWLLWRGRRLNEVNGP
jgi:TRAP-type C4-dicarboxylate transport system permease small subunit